MGRKAVSDKVRWQIVCLLKFKTKSQREIALMCNVSLKCVQTMLKNHELHNDVKDLPKLGRPLKLTSNDQSYLYRKIRQDPKISYRELAEGFINTSGNVSISRWTVRRCLNKKGLDCYVATRKALLRVSDRLKRLK